MDLRTWELSEDKNWKIDTDIELREQLLGFFRRDLKESTFFFSKLQINFGEDFFLFCIVYFESNPAQMSKRNCRVDLFNLKSVFFGLKCLILKYRRSLFGLKYQGIFWYLVQNQSFSVSNAWSGPNDWKRAWFANMGPVSHRSDNFQSQSLKLLVNCLTDYKTFFSRDSSDTFSDFS